MMDNSTVTATAGTENWHIIIYTKSATHTLYGCNKYTARKVLRLIHHPKWRIWPFVKDKYICIDTDDMSYVLKMSEIILAKAESKETGDDTM